MAHSYTPGLTVSERTTIQRKRLLPLPGMVLVRVGERVQAGTPVARAQLPGKVVAMNLANQLGVAPGEIHDYLIKKEGDQVRKDEIIAENKPFIKWFKTEITSPITGTIESISPITGQVLFREPPKILDVQAYIDGTVVEIHEQQGVTIETTCSLVQGIFGIGGETSGEIAMAVAAPDQTLAPNDLTSAMKGKVVVGGIHDKDLRALLGYDLGVAITGTEQVGFTLVLTEGFGTIPMATKTFRLLATHAGQKASVSGATQIRAGVIRPEVIIPQALSQQAAVPAQQREGIKVGDPVRIIRDPLFGIIGEVSRLPSELQKIPTESDVRVLEVRFGDGRTAVIPRANIEVIEGA